MGKCVGGHAGKVSAKKGAEMVTVEELLANEQMPRGQKIMTLAEIMRPYLQDALREYRDENGMLFQPATVRGIALNAAQNLVLMYESETVH